MGWMDGCATVKPKTYAHFMEEANAPLSPQKNNLQIYVI